MKTLRFILFFLIICLAPASSLLAFDVDDRVQCIGTNVNIRSTYSASANFLGKADGKTGTIVDGPENAEGYRWWKISWDSSVTGWSVEYAGGATIEAVSAEAPTLDSISPDSVVGQSTSRTFTLSGSNFVSGAKVQVAFADNGYTFTDTSNDPSNVSSTQITVSFNTQTTVDTWKVRVKNPDGQTSGSVNLAVTAAPTLAPTLSSISPNSVAGKNALRAFTLTGSNFKSGAKVQVAFADNGYTFTDTANDPSNITASQITVSFNTQTTVDTWKVRVKNPDGQTSGSVNLAVTAPAVLAPTLSSISPNSVVGLNASRIFTLSGNNFQSGAKVQVAYASNGYTFTDTASAPSNVTLTQITVSFNTQTTVDTWKVRVKNPDGQTSSSVNLAVTASSTAPTLSAISPNSVVGQNSLRSFTLSGSNFQGGAKVQVAFASNNYIFTDTVNSPSNITSTQITVSFNTQTTVDTWKVRVKNPDGKTSGSVNLAVTGPASNNTPVQVVSGQVISGISVAKGESLNYRVYLSAAGPLIITLSGGTGNASLYYKAGGQPGTTAGTFDQKSTTVDNNESISIVSATRGWHYFTIYGTTAASGILLRMGTLPLLTTSVSIAPLKSALIAVTAPRMDTSLLNPGEFGANFGLEFRVKGLVQFYVADSSSVSASNPNNLAAGNGGINLPDAGEVLNSTVENKVYYVRLVNNSFVTVQAVLRADIKPLKIIPLVSSQGVTSTVDNYFVCHGRDSGPGSFTNLSNAIAYKLKGTAARCFRIDWSDAAKSNYPSLFGLQGSRFIKPAGATLRKLVVDQKGVPPARIRLWGHSWGSYVSSEFAKASGEIGMVKSLVALDPAETDPLLTSGLGNVYTPGGLNLKQNTSFSFAMVASGGALGGESEAATAYLTVKMNVTLSVPELNPLTANLILHDTPKKGMEYSLSNWTTDAVSKALVKSAFFESGRLNNIQGLQTDATLSCTVYPDDDNAVYINHSVLKNGTAVIKP